VQSVSESQGVDVDRLGAWAAGRLGWVPPLQVGLVAGGKSNLTYCVSDADGRVAALRRPPLHGVLPTAHDMVREHRIIAALRPTAVPVPEALAVCDDTGVLGAAFYLMSWVEGHVVAEPGDAVTLELSARHRSGLALAETLARLHAIDIDGVGLGDLARRDNYANRQLRRWREQFAKTATRGIPEIERVHDLLAASVPEQHATSIVHGDYRLGNCMVDDAGEVVAVLDWELCTLGDPLADVGLLAIAWPENDREHLALPGPNRHPGFASRGELIGRYAELTGRDTSHINFFIALAYWRLACIIEGVYNRTMSGAQADKNLDVDLLRSRPPVLAALAEEWAHRAVHP
jgi:aminoglycoside phosphotransferase (APT) family kinase protein